MKHLTKFQSYLNEKGYAKTTVEQTCYEVKAYREWLLKQNKRVQQATYEDALAYIKHLKKRHLKPQTINFYLLSVKHYYNHLRVKRNPFQGLFIKGTVETVITNTLTKEELLSLYENLPYQTNIQMRNKVLFGLYAFQGLYSSEADKIQTSDINLKKGLITIQASRKRGKRTLQLENIQMFDLQQYIKTTRKELLKETQNKTVEDRLIFSSYTKDDLTNLRVQLNRQLKCLSATYKDIATLRVSVIVNWLKEENLRVVMYKAGHKHVSSTERYKKNDISKLKEVVLEKHPLG